MGLYRKSQQLLYKEFVRRSYQGLGEDKQEALLQLNLETISLYKQERDIALRALEAMSILLHPSKSISLKESLCRLCEALDLEYYVLYLFNRKKSFFEKRVHYSKTPSVRDAIMKKGDRMALSDWELCQKNGANLFGDSTSEVQEELERNKNRVAALVWRKTLSPEAQASIKPFVRGFSLYALETF